MVRSAHSCVESKDRRRVPLRPLFGEVQSSCPCHCGGKAFRWTEGASLTVCFRTMAGVRELIHLASLAPSQKQLLHVFLHHARDKHACWPGGLRLLESTGLRSRQTLSTHKKALRALGILDWLRPGEEGNRHASALYRLNWPALQALVEQRLVSPARSSGLPEDGSREPSPSSETGLPSHEAPVVHESFSPEPPEPLELPAEETALDPPDEASPEETTAVRELPPVEAATPTEEPPAPPEPLPAAREAFEVSTKLVWSLWREAYQKAYARVYLAALADQQAVRVLARSCSQAVLHHTQHLSSDENSPEKRAVLVQQFLRHVFKAFLARSGRNNFLRERAHPLSALPGDLNMLGLPWSSPANPKPATPAPRAVAAEPLSAEENQRRLRSLLATLGKERSAGRPGTGVA